MPQKKKNNNILIEPFKLFEGPSINSQVSSLSSLSNLTASDDDLSVSDRKVVIKDSDVSYHSSFSSGCSLVSDDLEVLSKSDDEALSKDYDGSHNSQRSSNSSLAPISSSSDDNIESYRVSRFSAQFLPDLSLPLKKPGRQVSEDNNDDTSLSLKGSQGGSSRKDTSYRSSEVNTAATTPGSSFDASYQSGLSLEAVRSPIMGEEPPTPGDVVRKLFSSDLSKLKRGNPGSSSDLKSVESIEQAFILPINSGKATNTGDIVRKLSSSALSELFDMKNLDSSSDISDLKFRKRF